jgi:O-antigen biosynthesis protein
MGLGRAPGDAGGRTTLLVALGGTRAAEVSALLSTGARNLGFDPGADWDSASDPDWPLRICIASYEFVGPTKTGGIGTAYTSLAEALAEAGHEVTVLYLGGREADGGAPFSHWVKHYASRGIRLEELREEDFPTIYCGHVEARRSYLAYMWLTERDRQQPFDVIHFPETLGHGYYTLLAKRGGFGFQSTTIAVGVHSSTYWVMETNRMPFLTGQEFAADFVERATAELADVVISPSAYMLDWMGARGWKLPERVFVQQYVQSRAVSGGKSNGRPAPSRGDSGDAIEEIVFFGRLEVRKGIVLFCDALDLLAADGAMPGVSIAFLGKEAVIGDAWARGYIARRAKRWPWKWHVRSRFGQPEAIAYLRGDRDGRRRLAVMPSLADNTPNTVMEALALRIPFIASRVGGTAELIHPLDLARSTFDPSGPDGDAALAALLRDAVEASEFRPAEPAVDPSTNEAVHVRWHEAVFASSGAEAPPGDHAPADDVSISAPVTAYVVGGGDARVGEVISSLEAQRHPGVEVVVLDDGSAEARNAAARAARSDHLLFLASDAVLEPHAISTMIGAAAKGADVVVYPVLWDVEGGHAIRIPEGGPPVAGLFYRCFGETGYLIRRKTFNALGGFRSDSEPGFEDHVMLCRAALAGFDIQVVPEPLAARRVADLTAAERAIHADSDLVLRVYQERTSDGLSELPRVARAQWRLAGSRASQFEDVVSSRSWRLTRPLRWVSKQGRRLRAAR